jgi:hypothetical protein
MRFEARVQSTEIQLPVWRFNDSTPTGSLSLNCRMQCRTIFLKSLVFIAGFSFLFSYSVAYQLLLSQYTACSYEHSALLAATGNKIVELRYKMRSGADTGWVGNIQHMARNIAYTSQIPLRNATVGTIDHYKSTYCFDFRRILMTVTFLSVRKHGTSYTDKNVS